VHEYRPASICVFRRLALSWGTLTILEAPFPQIRKGDKKNGIEYRK
jgi:hypothetical protein